MGNCTMNGPQITSRNGWGFKKKVGRELPWILLTLRCVGNTPHTMLQLDTFSPFAGFFVMLIFFVHND